MINSVLRKLATYLSFFFKIRRQFKKNEQILKNIYPKISKYKPQNSNLKKTHQKFNLEVMKLLKEKNSKFFKGKFYSKNVFCS